MTRPVDYDELAASYERRYAQYAYPGVESAVLAFAHGGSRVLEVGCGTGHYLRVLREQGHAVVGLDASRGMLARAAGADAAQLVQASALCLPFAAGSFDRVCAINAFHHFEDKARFVREARRVLAPGGALLVAGYDPHVEARWWIYDYYPNALATDRARFLASPAIEQLALESGFVRATSRQVQHMSERGAARALLDAGKLAQSTTSQLALLTVDEYQAGIERLGSDIARAEAEGTTLEIEADLRMRATIAWAG